MFTGIVQGTAPIKSLEANNRILRYSVELPASLLDGIQLGASVSIDGCCQTVVKVEGSDLYFQAISETLKRTTMASYKLGQEVNIERSARFGDEIGGHILSGHVMGTASLHKVERVASENVIFSLKCDSKWMSYIFEKGFIAVDGASLTVVDVFEEGMFTVHLIPETLKRTTFKHKTVGSLFNIEIDSQTQAIVQTVERLLYREKKLGN